MIHKQRLLATSILIIWSLLGAASFAEEATGLVLKGDACIRAEGFGQLERATLAELEKQLLAHQESKGLQPQIDLVRSAK